MVALGGGAVSCERGTRVAHLDGEVLVEVLEAFIALHSSPTPPSTQRPYLALPNQTGLSI